MNKLYTDLGVKTLKNKFLFLLKRNNKLTSDAPYIHRNDSF